MSFERTIALLGIFGTLIGLVMPLLYQRQQATRERRERLFDVRRSVYADVYAELLLLLQQLQVMTVQGLGAIDLSMRSLTEVNRANADLALVASPEVYDTVTAYLSKVKELQDRVNTSLDGGHPTDLLVGHSILTPVADELDHVRRAMQAELGAP